MSSPLLEFVLTRYKLPDQCSHCFNYTRWSHITGRVSLACQYCGYQISPLADTVLFRKSRLRPEVWRIAYQLLQFDPKMTVEKIRSITGTTYPTTWRMRKLLLENPDEADYYLG